MTDLEEALCNPLLVTDERFDLTREAATEIKRLTAVLTSCRELREYDLAEIEQLRSVVDWVDSWVSNPVGSYSVSALDGLFAMTRDKIAALAGKER